MRWFGWVPVFAFVSPYLSVVQSHLRGSPSSLTAWITSSQADVEWSAIFFCYFSSLGLGSLPADNSVGHTCSINDCSALPPVFTQLLYFNLRFYQSGTEKNKILSSERMPLTAPAPPECHRSKRFAYPLSLMSIWPSGKGQDMKEF